MGDGANGEALSRRLARRIARSRPDRLLYVGDVYEDGTREEFRTNYAPVYGAMRDLTAPTPGNHEWGNRDQGYDECWRAVRGRVRPYYSFKTAGWEILSLNSEIERDEGLLRLAGCGPRYASRARAASRS